ncbi:MAG: CDP-alcohol phosphatidyltransferase family protein [Pseudomonadota bacterium]
MAFVKLEYFPNIITIFRIILVFPIGWALLNGHFDIAFLLVLIAGISDGLDGYIARQFHWTSDFGAFTDPLADKLLMLVVFSSLTWLGIIPLWFFLLLFCRDVLIMLGVMIYRRFSSQPNLKASWLSKINTSLQIVFALLVLFNISFIKLPDIVTDLAMLVVVVFTVMSFFGYAILFFREYYFSRSLN